MVITAENVDLELNPVSKPRMLPKVLQVWPDGPSSVTLRLAVG